VDARRHHPRAFALIALAAALIVPARVLAGSVESYFLVATRDLRDPTFSETVILMIPVSEDGLVDGVIINKPTHMRVQDLISGAAVLPQPAETAFFGGPVEVNTPLILVRATRAPEGAIHVFEDIYVVTAPAQISSYMKSPPATNGLRLIIGRAQWMPDQLMAEMAEGSWYKAPAEAETVFSSDPAKVWEELVKRGQLQEADAGARVEKLGILNLLNFAGSCLVWAGSGRGFSQNFELFLN
jgi:putative transcriptional regulator